MPLVLEVVNGPDAGLRFGLGEGRSARVGRGPRSDLVVPRDRSLSDPHFLVELRPDGGCRLRALPDAGATLVNGARARDLTLSDADHITAGLTTFAVHLDAPASAPARPIASAPPVASPSDPIETLMAPASPPPPRTAPAEPSVVDVLAAAVPSLYALVDAARDPGVLALLGEHDDRRQSLYAGEEGDKLAGFAPYLVDLPPGSALRPALVAAGWGKAWGVFLASPEPFDAVRKHFRRFLLVRDEAGEEFYFRFYDPRVLRIFLPTCTPEQSAEFFGPIAAFLVEGDDPAELLTFEPDRPRRAARVAVEVLK